MHPPSVARKTICSGELENRLADAAGIMNNDVTSKIPTTFIASATITANRSMNNKFTDFTETPSTTAISSSTVSDSNGFHKAIKTANIEIPIR